MADSAVSFLLNQLSVMLRDERKLLKGLKQEVQLIHDELVNLRDLIRVADAKEETDNHLKEWVGQLREISFDVQDVLDRYTLQFEQQRSKKWFRDNLRKVSDSIKNLKYRHRLASEIKSINSRSENVRKSQQNYREMSSLIIDQPAGSSSSFKESEGCAVGGHDDAWFLEDDEVVGIEEPKEQLLGWIRSMTSGLDVISIVGTGGLGKTTLVKKVYDDESVKNYFDLHASVVVSDYKDVKHLMICLIKKLNEEIKEPPPRELEGMSILQMKNFIRDFLKEKKYIIVLDDVRNLSIWEDINFVFPRNGGHGCIIITTRSKNIADAACSNPNHVFNLRPLSKKYSSLLFFKRAFPIKPCPLYLKLIAEKICRRCAGLPLAIVMISGLLATKNNRMEEWDLFNRSLTHELEGGRLVRLGRLFFLSYNDLPYYLKYCFLYLSIFPEGGLLEKEKVLRLWIAEGFVQSKHDGVLEEEVAEEYLNELWSRGLIQEAKKQLDGRVRAFRIHDLLRDYITLKSREHNIVTVYNGEEKQWPNKIRRLAIQSSASFTAETNNLEHLRSVLVFSKGGIEAEMIKKLVSKSSLLKVLELRAARINIIPDGVSKLYHLKHLCLRDTLVEVVPTWIKNLRNLETLDLKNTRVTELPIEILQLQKLRHLLVYKYKYGLYRAKFGSIESFRAPYGIGSHLQSLQKLRCVDADEVGSVKIVKEIGKLTKLRRLGIAKLRSGDGEELCRSIAKLTSLRSLRIDSVQEDEKLDIDHSLSSTGMPFLRTLALCGSLEKIPQWIPFLHSLATLHLRWSKLSQDPLTCLQALPALTWLLIQDANVEGLNFKGHGFRMLKQLDLIKLKSMKWVRVERGSMRCLGDWRMCDCKLLVELPQGIEHLTSLQHLGLYNMSAKLKDMVRDQRKVNGKLARLPRLSIRKL